MNNELSPTVVDLFESAIDGKIATALGNTDDKNGQRAQVTRIDKDGSIWARLMGSSMETPISLAYVHCAVGDIVSVIISDGRAVINGNLTMPAIGAAYVDDVVNASQISFGRMVQASEAAASAAELAAKEAAETIEATNQHFWHNDNGAHITDDDQNAFLEAESNNFPDWNPDPDSEGYKPWYNVVLNSLGQVFRTANKILASFTHSAIAFFDGEGNNASNIVAQFGKTGAQIGKTNSNHVIISADGLGIFSGNDYADVNGVDVIQTSNTANTASSTANNALSISNTASNTANNALNISQAVYGISSTAAATKAKTVSCAGFKLFSGALVTIKFSNASTYATDAVQLNINSTGAKNVWVANAVTSATNQLLWGANAVITFRYDGTQYQVIGDPRAWHGNCSIAAATAAKTDAAKVATGAVICAGATISLNMTNDNTATAPTLNIAGTGAKNLYAGSGTVRPLTSNGLGWTAGSTIEVVFDGQYWRVGDTAALARAKAAQDAANAAKTAADAAQTTADNAAKGAAEAQATANATKQNFWADTSGVHVSTQANTAAGTFNSLFNANGLLFRKASNNLISLTGSALNFYDGSGNAAANVQASFGTTTQLGKTADYHYYGTSTTMGIYPGGSNTAANAVFYVNNTPSVRVGQQSGINAYVSSGGFYIRSGTTNVGSFTYKAASDITYPTGAGTTMGLGSFTSGGIDVLTLTPGKTNSGNLAFFRMPATSASFGTAAYGGVAWDGGSSAGLWASTAVGINFDTSSTDGIELKYLNGTTPLQVKKGDDYGHALLLGAGGLTVVGSGEFANNFYTNGGFAATSETLHLGSDGATYIYTNGNNIANRKTWTFATSGNLTLPTAGYIMTRNTTQDRAATSLAERTDQVLIAGLEKNGSTSGRVIARQGTNGQMGVNLESFRYNASGTGVWNTFRVAVNADGTRAYEVSDPAAFRKAIGVTKTVLYNNTTGTNGTVTLSQTAANFNHMRIFFKTSNDSCYSSVDVYAPNGKSVLLISGWAESGKGNIKVKRVAISGTSITKSAEVEWSATATAAANVSYVNIVRVEAWNE